MHLGILGVADIRMILACQFPIRALDVILCRVTLDTHDFVVIGKFHLLKLIDARHQYLIRVLQQSQEFFAGLLLAAKVAEHAGCRHGRILLLYAAHHHAHMLRLDDDADTLRLD